LETTPTVSPTIVWRAVRFAAFGLLAACSGFDQRAEFWPALDASPGGIGGAGGSVVTTATTAETGGGGATGTGGAGGDPTTGTGEAGTGGVTTGMGGGGGETTGGGGFGPGGTGGSGGSPDAGKGMTGGAGGRGGSTGAGGTQGGGGASGSCSLAVTVTTVTNNGTYSPRNIGAIWVTRDTGAFVKTLAVWARTRIRYLTLWNSTTSGAGVNGNTVDAVTGATLSSHQTHKVTWNCTDSNRNVVPDGAYRVYFEMTDRSGTGPNTFVNFTKGPTPFNSTPPDQRTFTQMSLVFTP
jgi:hypothetical protein